MRRGLLFLLLGLLAAGLGLWLWLVRLEKEYLPDPNQFSLIEDRLYMGPRTSAPPPGTTAVLNLCESEDEYQAANQRWQPIRDAGPAPEPAWLAEQVDWIDAQRKAGATVYVHCMNGVSRSGLVVTAYLMREHGWSRDQALEFLRGKRPEARPHPAFMKLLKEWETRARDAK